MNSSLKINLSHLYYIFKFITLCHIYNIIWSSWKPSETEWAVLLCPIHRWSYGFQGNNSSRSYKPKSKRGETRTQIFWLLARSPSHSAKLLYTPSPSFSLNPWKKRYHLREACEACLLSPPSLVLLLLLLSRSLSPCIYLSLLYPGPTISSALFCCCFFFPTHSCSFYLQAAPNMGIKNYRNQEEEWKWASRAGHEEQLGSHKNLFSNVQSRIIQVAKEWWNNQMSNN